MGDLTPEENNSVKEYIRKLAAFSSGESKTCPMCGESVTGATLYEKWEPELFSLYVRPCNHRLGLWGKAPDWIADVEIVPVDNDASEDYPDDETGGDVLDYEAQERAGQLRLPGCEDS
jgi:hypothetical protein